MKSKKHLSFGSLRHFLSEVVGAVPDKRDSSRTSFEIHDVMMSGFACMYFQDPSLLEFQKRLEDEHQRSNLRTLFEVEKVPEETQMRELIDEVESEELRVVFKEYFHRLQRGKHLEQYQIFPGLYLCSMDGSQYFSSKNIHCEQCLTKEHRSAEITYSHQVVQGAFMHPDLRQVIPVMPEEISNTDGVTKQDCEKKAAKRFVAKVRQDHPQLGIIICGDALFSKQPILEDILEKRMHYIVGAKPDDHKAMMEWLKEYEELNEVRIAGEKGRSYVYQWMNEVPLNGREDSLSVNYFKFHILAQAQQGTHKVTYVNSWVTDFAITQENVGTLVKAGRCRWKIENECFNTLKNQGYHIEHNYGHGKKNLCYNFYLLTLVAFFFHQIFELTDGLYQACRKKFGSKRHMWETLRAYIKILLFDTWQLLLEFALNPKRFNPSYQPP